MTVMGSWKVVLSLPVGSQEMTLIVERADSDFSGRIESAMGNFNIVGSLENNRLRWDMKAKKPVPITVNFDVVITHDRLAGTARLGMFGKGSVTGERITPQPAHALVQNSATSAEIDAITGTSVDPLFNQPRVEIDEWRDTPVRHRYVHGGFAGTDARFSLYFPPAERYQGRFFHNTYPLITHADIGPFPIQFDVAVGDLGFTIDSGAYYLQTNLGGADRAPPADPAIAAYRVNAAAAKFSRRLAADMYGAHHAYGYLFGGSGGSYQVMGAAENTEGVWDGFLPFVLGTPHAIPSMLTIRQHALRVLRQRDKLAGIVDATEPGGSGDPYADLDDTEAAALREATLMGFPLRGWWSHATMTSGYYAHVAPLVPMLDPTYVDDFWRLPGYLGTDPTSSIGEERFTIEAEIAAVIEGFPKEILLAEVPARDISDAHLVVTTGPSAGRSLPIAHVDGRRLGFAMAADQAPIGSLKQGDPVHLDNRWTLAMQTYHRHQVPTPDLYGWNQYRDAQGQPIYPQRDVTIGLIGASNTAGCVPTGKVTGHMLLIGCLMDIDALPWQTDWYYRQVKAGADDGADRVALWFIDNATHENPLTTAANAHIVSYAGALQQGLRDLAAWVETGVHPGNTTYKVDNTQIIVPMTAAARGGIQPVIRLIANGGPVAQVAIGEEVQFEAEIEVPGNAGKVVAAAWDFDGVGTFPESAPIARPHQRLSLMARHAYAQAGTYFAVIRVASQRHGDQATAYGRIQNLARVRVVVTS